MKLPAISGEVAVKAFRRAGYEIDHQTGSHLILRHKDRTHRRLTVLHVSVQRHSTSRDRDAAACVLKRESLTQ